MSNAKVSLREIEKFWEDGGRTSDEVMAMLNHIPMLLAIVQHAFALNNNGIFDDMECCPGNRFHGPHCDARALVKALEKVTE